MTALLTLAKSLGIDPGPLNQAELQEQTCSKALAEIQHLRDQLDKTCEEGCTPGDAKKLREFNHGLADEVMKLKKTIATLRSSLQAANEGRNHFVRLYNETAAQAEQFAAEAEMLRLKKRRMQVDQYADGMPAQKAFWEGFERGAIKGPVNIRSHWEEWKSFRQRAQVVGDE